jgi:RNA polymerase-binding protein DksA
MMKRVKARRKTARKAASAAKKKTRKPKRMPKAELKKYKGLLLKEREEIGGEISHITKDTLKQSQREATGDLSGYSYHMADIASDNYEREFSLGRATDEQKLLYSIDEALRRISDGTYGNCVQCGKVISKKRLAAIPHTELCIDCQKKNEA